MFSCVSCAYLLVIPCLNLSVFAGYFIISVWRVLDVLVKPDSSGTWSRIPGIPALRHGAEGMAGCILFKQALVFPPGIQD